MKNTLNQLGSEELLPNV